MRIDELTAYTLELQACETELATLLKDWIPRGGEESFTLYERYRDSGYVALPFAGGFVDQPEWWTSDVDMFELLSEKHRIPGIMKQIQGRLKQIAEAASQGNTF